MTRYEVLDAVTSPGLLLYGAVEVFLWFSNASQPFARVQLVLRHAYERENRQNEIR